MHGTTAPMSKGGRQPVLPFMPEEDPEALPRTDALPAGVAPDDPCHDPLVQHILKVVDVAVSRAVARELAKLPRLAAALRRKKRPAKKKKPKSTAPSS